jgi:hypothetical protein
MKEAGDQYADAGKTPEAQRAYSRKVAQIIQAYLDQHYDSNGNGLNVNGRPIANLNVVGTVAKNGLPNLAFYDYAQPTAETLTFFWTDTGIGMPAAGGPAVGSVNYLTSADPFGSWTSVGVSTAPSSSFALDFMPSVLAPWVLGVPYDVTGAPINLTGVDGFNVAPGLAVNADVPVPEPISIALAFLGAALLLAAKRN